MSHKYKKILFLFFSIIILTILALCTSISKQHAAYVPPPNSGGGKGGGSLPSCMSVPGNYCASGTGGCYAPYTTRNDLYSCPVSSISGSGDCCVPPIKGGPFCGDKICNNGETTSTCPIDCPASSGGNAGSGGNSGSGTPGNSSSGGGAAPCFPAGTKISMADGTKKNIEDVKVGEKVLGYDYKKNVVETVLALHTQLSNNLYVIQFKDGTQLKITSNHPLYTTKGWESIAPDITHREIPSLSVGKLGIGDGVRTENGTYDDITTINFIPETIRTYNLEHVSDYNDFFAGTFLAHNYSTNASGASGQTYYTCNFDFKKSAYSCAVDNNQCTGILGINNTGNTCYGDSTTCAAACTTGANMQVNPLNNDPNGGTASCGPAGQNGACWKGGCPTGTTILGTILNKSIGVCGDPKNGKYANDGLCCVPVPGQKTPCEANGNVCVIAALLPGGIVHPTCGNGQPALTGNGFQCQVGSGNVCCPPANISGTGKNYCGQCAGNTCSTVGAYCLQAADSSCGGTNGDNTFAVFTCDKQNDLWQFKYNQQGGGGTCTCNDTGAAISTSSTNSGNSTSYSGSGTLSICSSIQNQGGGTLPTCGSAIKANTDTLYTCDSTGSNVTTTSCNGSSCVQCGAGFQDVCGSSPLNCPVGSPTYLNAFNKSNLFSDPTSVCTTKNLLNKNLNKNLPDVLCAANYGVPGAQKDILYDCSQTQASATDCTKTQQTCTNGTNGNEDSCTTPSSSTSNQIQVSVIPSNYTVYKCSKTQTNCNAGNPPFTISASAPITITTDPVNSWLTVSQNTISSFPAAPITVTINGTDKSLKPNTSALGYIIIKDKNNNELKRISVQISFVVSSTLLASTNVLGASTTNNVPLTKQTQFPTTLSFYPDSIVENSQSNLLAKVLAAQVYTARDILTYNAQSGYLVNPNYNLNTIPPGNYKVFAHIDKYLDAQIVLGNGSQTLSPQLGTVLAPKVADMTPGDIAPAPHGDNIIDIQDYNQIISCINGLTCPNKQMADLDNNGVLDQRDLDILISHFGDTGAQFSVPQFTCVTDPICAKNSTKTIQLCPLKCTKIPVTIK